MSEPINCGLFFSPRYIGQLRPYAHSELCDYSNEIKHLAC